VDNSPSGRVKLVLTIHGDRLDVDLPWYGKDLPSHLIDSLIRVRGVCGTVSNRLRQLVGRAS